MQPFDQNLFTNAFIQTLEVDPTEDQRKAIRLLSYFISGENGHRIFLLKGYAGTGKTTLMAALTKIIPRFILLAPTGRAAKVLTGYSFSPTLPSPIILLSSTIKTVLTNLFSFLNNLKWPSADEAILYICRCMVEAAKPE